MGKIVIETHLEKYEANPPEHITQKTLDAVRKLISPHNCQRERRVRKWLTEQQDDKGYIDMGKTASAKACKGNGGFYPRFNEIVEDIGVTFKQVPCGRVSRKETETLKFPTKTILEKLDDEIKESAEKHIPDPEPERVEMEFIDFVPPEEN